jgi:hypothetical protein
MQNKLKTILAWSALAAGLLMIVLFLLSSGQRERMLTDKGETRMAIDSYLTRLNQQTYRSGDDPALLAGVTQFSKSPYLALTWLFTPQGKALYISGGPQKIDSFNLDHLVTQDAQRTLAALPQGELSPSQELQLKISSAMQAEGEHGDVFHYRVEKLKAADGSLVAYLAFAYDISPSVGGAPDMLYMLSLITLAGCALVYWFSLPLWVWIDARQRGERAWVWALFILMGNLVALIAYLLVRQPARWQDQQAAAS